MVASTRKDTSTLTGNICVKSEKRSFTRLTGLASWRSEYMIRTRLLRSLARGKPSHSSANLAKTSRSRSSFDIGGNRTVTYSSGLYTAVTHLHASFDPGKGKKLPRFVLGADEIGWARRTDVSSGKVDSWGSSDPQNFLQFEERFAGDELWGLGTGNVVGVPNVMDLSQAYGMVYGEGSPGGLVYFRTSDEMRGRFLAFSQGHSAPQLGIPEISGTTESICSVWMAKTASFLAMSAGLIGILSGSSYGVLTAFSVGTDGLRDQRLGRGELTARWVLSPGVPIIAIAVDESWNEDRCNENRSCVVVLNALGEIYYLATLPKRQKNSPGTKLDEQGLERMAWETGRTVQWKLVEPTRRVARPDPYGDLPVHGSYSPRSSWDGMGLTKDQLKAETREIERYLRYPPKHFRAVCEGWDMKRKLEVDFAGGGMDSKESVFVIECGGSGEPARIKRYTRFSQTDDRFHDSCSGRHSPATSNSSALARKSVFGQDCDSDKGDPSRAPVGKALSESLDSLPVSEGSTRLHEEWRITELSPGAAKLEEVTVTAMDNSIYSLLTVAEDPLLNLSANIKGSSPLATPDLSVSGLADPSHVPGQRARLLAVGTKNGTVLLWNMRGPTSGNTETINVLTPLRVIRTDSPQISCLALTALYLVHGGNDGLVQAWDPLASTTQPIRTLNSRFSSRARRRLVQAEASTQDIGVNLWAAGAVCLDPDPTVLRGMVALGAHLRYWSYSSSAANQYASRKRRVRRGERGSNSNGERVSGTGRGALHDYIANERFELERENNLKRRENDRLAGRFGVGLLGQGESEESVLAYAKMLSEEAYAQEEERRRSETDSMSGDVSNSSYSSSASSSSGGSSSSTVTRSSPSVTHVSAEDDDDEFEDDLDSEMAEALRRSLLDAQPSPPHNLGESSSGGGSTATVPQDQVRIKSATATITKLRNSSSLPPPSSTSALESDLDFAIQLSLAEERSRRETSIDDEFPALERSGLRLEASSAEGQSNSARKGKRRAT